MRQPTRALIALLAAFGLIVGACGKSGNETASPTPQDQPACPVDALDQATGPVDVVLWHFLAGETGAALQQLADEYNAAQSKVRVHIESQGTTNDELWSKYQAGIGTRDLPAIAVADDTVTVDMVDSGTVLPAQSCIDADNYDMTQFLQPAQQYYTIDGVLYPASVNLSGALLYYNKNHFRRAGLDPNTTPQTLGEVRQYAEKIKASGAVDKPVILKVGPPLIEMWLTGVGQPVVNNDNGRGGDQTTEAAFDTDTTVQLYTWVQQMQNDGLLTVVPDVPGQIDQYLGLAQQKASMTIETSTAATTIEKFLSGDTSIAQQSGNAEAANVDLSALDIGAAPVPGIDEAGRLQMGGGAWYMTNTQPPEVQAAAWDFMKFFNSESSQVTWNLRGGYLPYRTSAVDTPAIQASWTQTTSGRWLAIAYDELLHGVDPDFPGPLMGPYDEFRKSIRSSVENMTFNGAAPSDVVTQAANETTDALQRYQDQNF